MRKTALGAALVIGILVGNALVALAGDPGPGCGVSNCHAPGTQWTLKAEVEANVKGHPPVTETATYNDCLKCHKSGKLALGPILHKGHYHEGTNHFTSNPKNNCQSCHYINLTDGTMPVQP